MHQRYLWFLFTCLSFWIPAQAITMHDPINYSALTKTLLQTKQLVAQLTHQYQMLQKQWQVLQQQHQQLKKNYQAMTGRSTWKHSNPPLHFWHHTVHDDHLFLYDTLYTLSGGNEDRLHELQKIYKQSYPLIDSHQYQKGSSDALLKLYQQEINNHQFGSALTTKTFDAIDQHTARIEHLDHCIEEDKNNTLKSAIDLNSKIHIEIALIHTAILRSTNTHCTPTRKRTSTTIKPENIASTIQCVT